jgi:DNA-binding NarL/FixJ family response regulator
MSIIILTNVFPLLHQAVAVQFQEQPGFELIDAGATQENMERLVGQIHPNLAIIDLDWVIPNCMNLHLDQSYPAFLLLQRLHETCPDTRFLILAIHSEPFLIDHAVELGIGGYLLKNDSLTLHLLDVARTICDGGYAFSQAVMSVKDSLSAPSLKPKLTSRQIEILEVIVSHPKLSYQEQAQRLGIAKLTLDTHLRTIFQKLDVSNLTAAVLTAVRLGIIPYQRLFSQVDDG